MIRRGTLIFLATCLCVLATGPASATGFSLFGAYYSPEDGNDETVGAGIRFSAHLGQHWVFDVGGTIYGDYEGFAVGGPSDIDLAAYDAGFRYRWGGGRTHAYLGAGGTFAKLESEFGELDDEGGWYALVGLDFGDDRGAKLFVEALYRDLDGTVKSFQDPGRVLEEIDISGYGINLGVTWQW